MKICKMKNMQQKEKQQKTKGKCLGGESFQLSTKKMKSKQLDETRH